MWIFLIILLLLYVLYQCVLAPLPLRAECPVWIAVEISELPLRFEFYQAVLNDKDHTFRRDHRRSFTGTLADLSTKKYVKIVLELRSTEAGERMETLFTRNVDA